MSELAPDLRSQLARVVVKARAVAEAGARKALKSLAVERHEPHSSMSPDERKLRNRLRAHGRQLGDVRDRQRGLQSIEKLVHEVAYEHWHRMLFARFLSENGLLIHPEHNVAMSTNEIAELARETGGDPHQMAARFAQDLLPQIFPPNDPVLEVNLAPESRQKLESLLDGLPAAVFTADDSLGWTYQYWQADKKNAVNASGGKIGADELPAVTQLFTEHYMVMFLYHNTLGAWYAGKVLAENPSLAETAETEDELRRAVALKTATGGSDWGYLRFVRESREGDEDDNPTGPWCPAAGTFEGWPRTTKDLKVLDPCCGSGHFLVAGFKLLVRLRMLEESLDLETAMNAVLRDNVFGLEIDPRCTQIAAFNLAVAAWKLAGKTVTLPPLNVACVGLSINASEGEWVALANNDERLRAGLRHLYKLFRHAAELGSLIDPRAGENDLFTANFDESQRLLREALAREPDNLEQSERTIVARGIAHAARILSCDFTLVITNPPYLLRAKQSNELREFLERYHQVAKGDLATSFVQRCERFCAKDGTHATVTPQNWLFLATYKGMRSDLLSRSQVSLVARVGSGATARASWDVLRALLVANRTKPDAASCIRGTEAPASEEESRSNQLKSNIIRTSIQYDVVRGPDARLAIGAQSRTKRLEQFAHSYAGLQTGDYHRFGRKFWELRSPLGDWRYHQGTVKDIREFSGRSDILFWQDGLGSLAQSSSAYIRGLDAHGCDGVAITQTRTLPASLYNGDFFDNNVAVIIPDQSEDLAAIWCFCSSEQFSREVRRLDEKLGVTNATIGKVPFDIDQWKSIAEKRYPSGLPEPSSIDPTQWIFHGNPISADLGTVLQVAVARLLGFEWPAEQDSVIRLADDARHLVEFSKNLIALADDDGIVCLPAVRAELPAAERLQSLLSAALGNEWSSTKDRELLAAASGRSRPKESLDAWLRDRFFEEHCKLFHHRPFIWHIWDGQRDGFHCLVNAHRLTGPNGEGRRTLEAVTYSYLGDWIQRQSDDQKAMVEGADARLAAAVDLQAQLENILKGDPPYDLFARWKPLHDQVIGWDPDINDGVRLNIRPFMNAGLRKGGKVGAGILRWKPNIKWGPKPDRGKESESLRPRGYYPWFWGCKGDSGEADRTDYTVERAARANFDGNRWNDLHYSRGVKESARVAAKNRAGESADS